MVAMQDVPTDQEGVFAMLRGWADEFILPYWPWIILVIIGAIVIRVIIRRAAPCLVIVAAIAVFSSVGMTGILTWFRDRGFIDGTWIPW